MKENTNKPKQDNLKPKAFYRKVFAGILGLFFLSGISLRNEYNQQSTQFSPVRTEKHSMITVYNIQQQKKRLHAVTQDNIQGVLEKIALEEGFYDYRTREEVTPNARILYISEKKKHGFIPIFGLHGLANHLRISITSEKFEAWLKYMVKNNYYFINDEQLLQGDFTRVPNNKKICLAGADDATVNQFTYVIQGDKKQIKSDSMVALLEKYLQREQGKINFTFYISHSTEPFLQKDFTREKLHYLADNFHIGNHTYNHWMTRNLSPRDFLDDITRAFEYFEQQIGNKVFQIKTLAYPYGILDKADIFSDALEHYSYKGHKLLGAFDYDGNFTPSPFSEKFQKWDIQRLALDNYTSNFITQWLETTEIYTSKRAVVIITPKEIIAPKIKTAFPELIIGNDEPVYLIVTNKPDLEKSLE